MDVSSELVLFVDIRRTIEGKCIVRMLCFLVFGGMLAVVAAGIEASFPGVRALARYMVARTVTTCNLISCTCFFVVIESMALITSFDVEAVKDRVAICPEIKSVVKFKGYELPDFSAHTDCGLIERVIFLMGFNFVNIEHFTSIYKFFKAWFP